LSVALYEKLVEWTRSGRRVAVATIVETVGSTPRKPGTKMLITDRLELYGTIGGGCVEADVIFAAREVLRTLRPKLIRVDIKAKNADELDMLCGGELTLYVEPVMPDCQLVICGGGHISKALAHVVQGLDFRLTVIDDRPQFANPDRFPQAATTITCEYPDLANHLTITNQTYAVVVTRGHSGDEFCLRALLNSPAIYIAMVGSRAKWANLRANLRASGFTDEQLARVHSPAGLDIGSVTPEEIAVSIAASLIQQRARHRGHQPAAEPRDE
jgi:xanthine dehydrogenase accessory factor